MMRWRDQSGPTRTPRSEGSVAAEGSKRPRVAVLVDSLRNSYQTTIIAGLSDAAARREVDLVVFAGGVLGAPGNVGVNRNFGFDLCDPAAFEGAVILGGALGNELGQSAIAAVCARFGALPLVSVAASAPGVPTLAVDEESGMRQALDHLVARHGFRRIAFVRGPTVNPEAERRFGVYRAVLEERGIGFDPGLVCVGTFERAAGEAAVATLIDDRKLDFDALVAANDYMALGAIPALEARGLQVPSDVAVVGFDDVEDARFSTPPLTTVRQPLYQQGEAALDLVLAKLSGREIALETAAPTELVVRQSCGCLSGLARPGRAGPVTMTATVIETLLAEHGEELRKHVARAVHGAETALPAGWDRQLLDAFGAELRGAGAGLFTATLDRMLVNVATSGDDVAAWQKMISALRKLLLPALPNEPLRWVQAEDLWHEARILIGDLAERAQAQHRLYSERLARVLTESGARLLATQEIPALAAAVVGQLPRLGIPGAFMALAPATGAPAEEAAKKAAKEAAEAEEADDAPAARGWATVRPLIAYDVEQPAEVAPPPLPATLAVSEILPLMWSGLGRRSAVVVEPLFFHERAQGCLLLEMGPREGFVYEALAEQVSSALEGARLTARLVEEATRRQVAERERLEKEMQIAAHIQSSILPRDVSVGGLEISALMQAATEVGGDYYDVVPVDDGCWIGIGDVAGHGLPTGLVMLMMQSGIGALARKMPDASPRDLLLALNTMLVENVRARMGQHEHATLTLIRYRRDGTLAFAGAHEEILIRRAETGRCERIATPGPWVGAKRDITAGTVDSAARLHPGDLLVLYTDGLTEAVAGDGSGARFGSDRLVALIEAEGAKPPMAVRDVLLAAVAAFAPAREDDVTVLVARYQG
jgi:DNA-binding LacI/PurR family transcriptional regulator/serine phosphatase RsbU (regulator of sigma subunit)